jgi:hypothetical protein
LAISAAVSAKSPISPVKSVSAKGSGAVEWQPATAVEHPMMRLASSTCPVSFCSALFAIHAPAA